MTTRRALNAFAKRLLILCLLLCLLKCAKGILKVDEATFEAPKDFKDENLVPTPLGSEKTAPSTKTKVGKKKTQAPTARLPEFKKEIPFKEGERTQYLLSYFAMKGGLVTLEVRPPRAYQGNDAFYFYGSVISSSLVNLFYRVDDWMDVLVDKKTFVPVRGSFSLNETAQVKQRIVLYDHTKSQAKFWSKQVTKENKIEEINRADSIPMGTQEMLSGLFYTRILRPKVGETITFPVYENGKNFIGIIQGLSDEIVTTRLGNFNCVKVQLTVQIEGMLKQTGNIYMWISKEPDAAMVKFAAEIKIGVIRGILIRKQTIQDRLDLGD